MAEGINWRIIKLAANKAPGVDGIMSNLFIKNADLSSEPLENVCRELRDKGLLPNDWKELM
jgi:hypothetical protein